MKDYEFMPDEIVNRQSQIKLLKDSFESIRIKGSKTIIIKGDSGTGKTSIVTKGLYNEITEESFFGYVKFLNMKNSPYYGIISIIDNLLGKILSEDNKSFSLWKEKIIKGLSSNSRYLANVSVNYRKVYGINNSVKNIDYKALRFNLEQSFIDILKVFSSGKKPLVLFIDDLQWADEQTISFFDTFYDEIMDLNILFILSFRSNEINRQGDRDLSGVKGYDIILTRW